MQMVDDTGQGRGGRESTATASEQEHSPASISSRTQRNSCFDKAADGAAKEETEVLRDVERHEFAQELTFDCSDMFPLCKW
jgi:hypothetical protein